MGRRRRSTRACVRACPSRLVEGDVSDHHRFKVGENVRYTSGPYGRAEPDAVYRITQLLPPEGDDQQYRIKSDAEPHERVVKESQLNPES
jgi:hypothetical protein